MIKKRSPATGWVRGQIGPYQYEAQVFNEPSPHGINGGRTSRLLVRRDDGSWLVNYDRGWDLLPTDEEASALVRVVLYEVEEGESDG